MIPLIEYTAIYQPQDLLKMNDMFCQIFYTPISIILAVLFFILNLVAFPFALMY